VFCCLAWLRKGVRMLKNRNQAARAVILSVASFLPILNLIGNAYADEPIKINARLFSSGKIVYHDRTEGYLETDFRTLVPFILLSFLRGEVQEIPKEVPNWGNELYGELVDEFRKSEYTKNLPKLKFEEGTHAPEKWRKLGNGTMAVVLGGVTVYVSTLLWNEKQEGLDHPAQIGVPVLSGYTTYLMARNAFSTPDKPVKKLNITFVEKGNKKSDPENIRILVEHLLPWEAKRLEEEVRSGLTYLKDWESIIRALERHK